MVHVHHANGRHQLAQVDASDVHVLVGRPHKSCNAKQRPRMRAMAASVPLAPEGKRRPTLLEGERCRLLRQAIQVVVALDGAAVDLGVQTLGWSSGLALL